MSCSVSNVSLNTEPIGTCPKFHLSLVFASQTSLLFFVLLLYLYFFEMVASSSNSSATALTNSSPPNLTFHEKLEGPNYLSWLTQFIPILRSQDSMGIVNGTEPCLPKFLLDAVNKETLNLAFAIWQRKDQTVLSWINITLSKKVLSTIYGLETSKQVWTALANQFANQFKSRIANLKKHF